MVTRCCDVMGFREQSEILSNIIRSVRKYLSHSNEMAYK